GPTGRPRGGGRGCRTDRRRDHRQRPRHRRHLRPGGCPPAAGGPGRRITGGDRCPRTGGGRHRRHRGGRRGGRRRPEPDRRRRRRGPRRDRHPPQQRRHRRRRRPPAPPGRRRLRPHHGRQPARHVAHLPRGRAPPAGQLGRRDRERLVARLHRSRRQPHRLQALQGGRERAHPEPGAHQRQARGPGERRPPRLHRHAHGRGRSRPGPRHRPRGGGRGAGRRRAPAAAGDGVGRCQRRAVPRLGRGCLRHRGPAPRRRRPGGADRL
ncbi:MAG: 3-oxoacyl-[acyl-carrier protein] reductase, partial [uncultured Acidimicrobiales bacterium]